MEPIQYTFLVLILTIALFIWDKLRADFVALMSMLALALGGILTPAQALKGFGDSTVVMIGALFVVGEGLVDGGYGSFDFFEYSWVGIPLLIATIAYMASIGRKILPVSKSGEKPDDLDSSMLGISESFSLPGKLFLAYITPESAIAGKTLAESELGQDYMITVLNIEALEAGHEPSTHHETRFCHFIKRIEHTAPENFPVSSTVIEPHAILVLKGSSTSIRQAAEELDFRIEQVDLTTEALSKMLVNADTGLAEVLITPRSRYRGITVRESNFMNKFGVQVMSIRRGEYLVTRQSTPLKYGDALLVRGHWPDIDLSIMSK